MESYVTSSRLGFMNFPCFEKKQFEYHINGPHENRQNKKFNRKNYPWLTDEATRIRLIDSSIDNKKWPSTKFMSLSFMRSGIDYFRKKDDFNTHVTAKELIKQ